MYAAQIIHGNQPITGIVALEIIPGRPRDIGAADGLTDRPGSEEKEHIYTEDNTLNNFHGSLPQTKFSLVGTFLAIRLPIFYGKKPNRLLSD